MASAKERLEKIEADLSEASTEITTELKNLRDQLEHGNPGDIEAVLVRLETAAKGLSDLVPQAPPAEPPAQS